MSGPRFLGRFLFLMAIALALASSVTHAAPPDAGPDMAAMIAPLAPTVQLVAVAAPPSTTMVATNTPAPPMDPLGTVTLVILVLGLLSAVARRVAPSVHFFQTQGGLLVLAVFSAVATGLTAALTSYGISWRALIAAAISSATSALCAWNPSAAKAAATAMLLFLVGSVSACAATPTDRARQTLTGVELTLAGFERGMASYEKPHELALVQQARDACKADPPEAFDGCAEAQARPMLNDFRQKRAIAEAAMASLRASIPVVEQVLDQADAAKQAGSFDAGPLLAPVLALAAELRQLLSLVGLIPANLAVAVGGK